MTKLKHESQVAQFITNTSRSLQEIKTPNSSPAEVDLVKDLEEIVARTNIEVRKIIHQKHTDAGNNLLEIQAVLQKVADQTQKEAFLHGIEAARIAMHVEFTKSTMRRHERAGTNIKTIHAEFQKRADKTVEDAMNVAQNAGVNPGFIAKVQEIMTKFAIAVINLCDSLVKIIMNKERVKVAKEQSQERRDSEVSTKSSETIQNKRS